MTKKQETIKVLKQNFRLVAVLANLQKLNNKGKPIEEWHEVGNYPSVEECVKAEKEYIIPDGYELIKFAGKPSLI